MVPFSERLFMNRKIKAYQAIIYIVLFYLAAVLFLLGPGKLLEKDRLLAGAENPVRNRGGAGGSAGSAGADCRGRLFTVSGAV